MLARAKEQGAKTAADNHYGHVQPADGAKMFAPVKAWEDDARQAHESTTGNAVAEHVRRHAGAGIQIQHADCGGDAAKVHHQQQILESQFGIDGAKKEISGHARGGDGHEKVQDAFA